MNAVASHFPAATKNAHTAVTAFHARSAHPAIVFQNSAQRFRGGGGALKFPPLSTDVFATSFETSHANPRVWNSAVAKNGNEVTFPDLFVRARSRILHASARVTFFVITSWITLEFRFEARVLSFPFTTAPASGDFESYEPFRP